MMELFIKWFVAFIFCIVLQTTLVPAIGLWGTQPDLIIMILCMVSLKYGMIPGIYIGFFVGLGQDIYSPALLGQNALAATVTGFCAGIFNEKMVRTDPVLKMAIILACFLIHDMLFIGVELIKNDKGLLQMFPQLLTATIPRALYTIVIVFGIFIWSTTIKPNLRR